MTNVLFLLQVVSALHYLHTQLKVIHRDVKPSNILINRRGEVKMCDFGISGYLVDSVAKTVQAGCKPYMAVSIVNFKKLRDSSSLDYNSFSIATVQTNNYRKWKCSRMLLSYIKIHYLILLSFSSA